MEMSVPDSVRQAVARAAQAATAQAPRPRLRALLGVALPNSRCLAP